MPTKKKPAAIETTATGHRKSVSGVPKTVDDRRGKKWNQYTDPKTGKRVPRSVHGKLTHRSQDREKKLRARKLQKKLLAQYARGKPMEDIALDEDMAMSAVARSISSALEREVRNFAEPSPQHQFVRYAAFNLDLIAKLDTARNMFMSDPEGKQYSMIVSSIKAQHDIYNAVMGKGYELGVIKRAKAAKAITGQNKAVVLQEIQKEAETLLDIVEEFDPHTQFRRRRRIQVKSTAREQTQSAAASTAEDNPVAVPKKPQKRTHAVYVRKVARLFGIVQRDLPNKMFRTTIYQQNRIEKPRSQWTIEDYEKTAIPIPEHLLRQRARQEMDELQQIKSGIKDTVQQGPS